MNEGTKDLFIKMTIWYTEARGCCASFMLSSRTRQTRSSLFKPVLSCLVPKCHLNYFLIIPIVILWETLAELFYRFNNLILSSLSLSGILLEQISLWSRPKALPLEVNLLNVCVNCCEFIRFITVTTMGYESSLTGSMSASGNTFRMASEAARSSCFPPSQFRLDWLNKDE